MKESTKYYLAATAIGVVSLSFIYRKKIFALFDKSVDSDAEISKKLTTAQWGKVQELHQKSKGTLAEFINQVEKKTGAKVLVTSGYRDYQKQAQLKKENPSNASAGFSPHNFGVAIDINVFYPNGKALGKATSKAEWEASGIPQIAKSMGLRWGGDFPNYHDPVHFDTLPLLKISTTELNKLAMQQFGNIEKAQGNKVKF